MMTNDAEISPKLAKKFQCEKCNYTCSKPSDLVKHKMRRDHKNDDKMMTNDAEISPNLAKLKNKEYECDCGKKYTYRQGLNVHRRKCNFEEKPPHDNNELIEYLIKENSDLKSMVLDVCKQIQPVNQISNSNINSHNKTFNLNVFLNEKCKDAMNINDFVESLQLQLTDLENVGKLGFVEGISNIIITPTKKKNETKCIKNKLLNFI
jgi:hypothetical protein